MANGAGGSIAPYFTIWTEPRATIRRIVDTNPTRNVIALAAIGPADQCAGESVVEGAGRYHQSVVAVADRGRVLGRIRGGPRRGLSIHFGRDS